MLSPKTIIIATCCTIAIVGGVYLGTNLYFNQSREDITPSATNNKSSPTAKEHINGDVGHDETQSPNNSIEQAKEAPATKDWTQYIDEERKWSDKLVEAGDDIVRIGEVLLNLLPSTEEEIARLSDEEKRMLAEKIREQCYRSMEAEKEFESVRQEEPIEPPENN